MGPGFFAGFFAGWVYPKKPKALLCNFLLVNNTNVYPMLHHFQDIADYWL